MKALILTLIFSGTTLASTCEQEIKQFEMVNLKKAHTETMVASGLTDALADIEIHSRRLEVVKKELKELDHMSSPKKQALETELEVLKTKLTKVGINKALLERQMRDVYDAFHAAQVLKDSCLLKLNS